MFRLRTTPNINVSDSSQFPAAIAALG